MLHILWLILKIAGIVLLALLAVLLLAFLMLMFVPFCYKGSFRRQKRSGADEDMETEIRADLTWLFFLFHAWASLADKKRFRVHVRVFGFHLLDIPERTEPEDGPDIWSDDRAFSPEETDIPISKPEAFRALTRERQEPAPQTEGTPPVHRFRYEDHLPERETEAETKTSGDQKRRPRRGTLSDRLIAWAKRVYGRLREWWKRTRSQYRVLVKNKGRILGFWRAPHTMAARRLIRRAVRSIFRHIRPGRLKGFLHIGRDDPEEMGKILSVAALFYPIYGKTLKVTPEFDRKILEGRMWFKGHFQLYLFAFWALRIFFDKQIRKTIRHFKYLKEDI